MKDSTNKLVVGCITVVLVALVLAFLEPLVFMWGWNYGVIALFPQLSAISYWTAFWVCALISACGTLFCPKNFKKFDD